MAYRFKLNETPEHGLRRIGLEQIDRALQALTANGQVETPIHETRKCLKRIRALLRLVGPGLKRKVYKQENTRFRNIGRLLSQARDSHVAVETLFKLEAASGSSDGPVFRTARSLIQSSLGDTSNSGPETTLTSARALLLSAQEPFSKLRIERHSFACVREGLEEHYRDGRHMLRAAYEDGSPEAFHDWRKSVQLHWRHMALLSRAWPTLMSARVEAARQLSQILGDSQDISMLISRLGAIKDWDLAGANRDRLIEIALERQRALLAQARPRGAQLFAMDPEPMSRSVLRCWKAARTMDEAEHEAGVMVAVAQPEPTGKSVPDGAEPPRKLWLAAEG
jgi:CHAD domain-containing protein